jgi:uridine kinase
MVNEVVQKEHVFVIQGDYYYQMVNDHKQIHKEEHQETKIEENKYVNLVDFFKVILPKHQLFRVHMEDIEIIQEPHN